MSCQELLFTPPRGIPFESRLVFTLGWKLLELVSHLEFEAGPRLADCCYEAQTIINQIYLFHFYVFTGGPLRAT